MYIYIYIHTYVNVYVYLYIYIYIYIYICIHIYMYTPIYFYMCIQTQISICMYEYEYKLCIYIYIYMYIYIYICIHIILYISIFWAWSSVHVTPANVCAMLGMCMYIFTYVYTNTCSYTCKYFFDLRVFINFWPKQIIYTSCTSQKVCFHTLSSAFARMIECISSDPPHPIPQLLTYHLRHSQNLWTAGKTFFPPFFFFLSSAWVSAVTFARGESAKSWPGLKECLFEIMGGARLYIRASSFTKEIIKDMSSGWALMPIFVTPTPSPFLSRARAPTLCLALSLSRARACARSLSRSVSLALALALALTVARACALSLFLPLPLRFSFSPTLPLPHHPRWSRAVREVRWRDPILEACIISAHRARCRVDMTRPLPPIPDDHGQCVRMSHVAHLWVMSRIERGNIYNITRPLSPIPANVCE